MTIADIAMKPLTSVWDVLPKPVASVNPRTFEFYGQNQGLAVYRTTLVGRKSGKLVITDLHDYAQVFVDGVLIGTLDRRLGEKSIDLPATTNAKPVLEILVEGMGHINFAQEMIDRKGITDQLRVQAYQTAALTPPTPWLGSDAPAAPQAAESVGDGVAGHNLTPVIPEQAGIQFFRI